MPKRALAIRASFGIHLQEAEIDPQLDLVLPIFGFEPSDDNLSRLIIPLVQQMRYVKVHAANMDGGKT